MKTLRRYYHENALYFVTVVTYNREPIVLRDPDLFQQCWSTGNLVAWVLMPDHLHAVVGVGESDISSILHQFKITYSRRYRMKFGPGRIWQHRFWDHLIRDEADLNHHLDYIHYNPVRHGRSRDPFEYPYSSLLQYLNDGMYERNWGVTKELTFPSEYGE
jgi:putative transposase